MPDLRPINLLQPSRVIFGEGGAADAVAELARPGTRVLVVTSPSVQPHADRFAASLRAVDAVVEIVGGISPEPNAAAIEALRVRARIFGPTLVLALGGGSVLDAAKLAATLHDHPAPLSEFYGQARLPPRRTGLVCVPTTAGTGSEVSPNALVYDDSSRTKKAVIGPALVPDVAIVDPGLMISLPPALTATTGVDALAHCLETYANRAANPVVDLRSLEGVRLLAAHLPAAIANGADLPARAGVALGSLYGGLGLGPVNTTGVHALAYPLGGEFHLPHGLSIGLLLSHVVRFNAPAMPARHAALARALGADSALSDAAAAEACADRLDLLLAACRVPRGLGAHGIPRAALPRLADEALQVTRLLKNNPREITRADALRIYESAF